MDRYSDATSIADEHLELGEGFVAGVLAKLVATLVTYPLLMSKVRLMASTSASTERERGSILAGVLSDGEKMVKILHFTAMMHGLRGLYKGVEFHLVGTSIKAALSMALRERFTGLLPRFRQRS